MSDQSKEDKTPSGGPWSPFKQRAFMVLWVATVLSNIGTWMHDVGAGWLMTELSPSPAVVALVQAATTLPVFLFALVAGAVADIVDRRKLLIWLNIGMGITAAGLAALVALELMTPLLLILFTFALGTGAAFMAPAWQAIVPKLVDRPDLPAAIALNSMGINVSRAIGPALAGFLIVAFGLAYPFALNAISFAGIILALAWWKPEADKGDGLPKERVGQAIRAGLRYVTFSAEVRATLVRAAAFFLFASAYWAMLPLIARVVLEGGATLYGILLAAAGAGAVLGALILPKVKKALGADKTVAAGSIGTAATLLLLALVPVEAVAIGASALAGLSWIAVLSNLHVSIQTALPDWVRARGLSIFLTVFFGSMAGGSVIWGLVAERTGVETSLLAAALGLGLFIPLTWRWKLNKGTGADLVPSMHWPEPVLADENGAETQGPVMIQITYQIAKERRAEFLDKMQELATSRKRGGGYDWALMEDSETPNTFIETWFEGSWEQHLRHHHRVSEADHTVQSVIKAYLAPGTWTEVRHFLTPVPKPDSRDEA